MDPDAPVPYLSDAELRRIVETVLRVSETVNRKLAEERVLERMQTLPAPPSLPGSWRPPPAWVVALERWAPVVLLAQALAMLAIMLRLWWGLP